MAHILYHKQIKERKKKSGELFMAERVVALLGGDQRELTLLPSLRAAGYKVQAFGLPQAAENCPGIAQAVQGAELLILPLPGVRPGGCLHAPFLQPPPKLTAADLAGCPAGTPVMVGVALPELRDLCQKLGLPVYEIAELDAVAEPNAVPTAEGAIQLTMQELPLTIDGLRAMVLGFGRVGEALARRLKALGAEVAVANRGEERRQRAARQGFAVCPWAELAAGLARCEVVYNTAPALVLSAELLDAMPPGALVVDLASGAGGVDFAAAEQLGIKAVHALSLPGKVAPVSAGRLLGRVYPQLIDKILSGKWHIE